MEIELDQGAIAGLEQAVLRAMQKTAEDLQQAVVRAMVVPFDVGTMQDTKTYTDTVVAGGEIAASLIVDGPYARYQYLGESRNGNPLHYQRGKNPNARDHWLEDWLPGGAQEAHVPDTFATLLKEEAGL